ncbi:MAG: nucleotidyltransferase domain-containing protein [Chitinispirillales bacterium]|nr:nucleotidyltransferase domain-containing protein [Chitinispirillales bacterium]
MTETVKTELDKIVSALVETGIVTKIILFGSHARGDGSEESDIDLCVLTSVKNRRPLDVGIDLRMKLWGVKTMPLDLFTSNPDEFSYRSSHVGSLEHEIAKEGVLIYECN